MYRRNIRAWLHGAKLKTVNNGYEYFRLINLIWFEDNLFNTAVKQLFDD